MDAPTFRGDFPEFTSTATFPDAQVNFWLTVAANALDAGTWGALYPLGIELYTAHNLVLSAKSAASSANGGLPGTGSGLVASKSVDKASISYNSTATSVANAGAWNLTDYGIRFYQFARQFGAGGLQAQGCFNGGYPYNPDTLYPYLVY